MKNILDIAGKINECLSLVTAGEWDYTEVVDVELPNAISKVDGNVFRLGPTVVVIIADNLQNVVALSVRGGSDYNLRIPITNTRKREGFLIAVHQRDSGSGVAVGIALDLANSVGKDKQ